MFNKLSPTSVGINAFSFVPLSLIEQNSSANFFTDSFSERTCRCLSENELKLTFKSVKFVKVLSRSQAKGIFIGYLKSVCKACGGNKQPLMSSFCNDVNVVIFATCSLVSFPEAELISPQR